MDHPFSFVLVWRLGMLIILFILLQSNSGNAWRRRRRRRNPPPPVPCKQSAWSSWSECEPFCGITPKKTKYRQVRQGNKCIRETSYQSCDPYGGCDQVCDNQNKRCTCQDGFTLQISNGKKCIDIDECKTNNGRGPCSHSCKNYHGGYYCKCEKGYQLQGRTRCVLRDCLPPTFNDCPVEDNQHNPHKFDANLSLCHKIKSVCLNGTKYNSQCTLSCPRDYELALKDPGKAWLDYSAFDFRTASNRIMCQAVSEYKVSWHTPLSNYYCRRSNDPPHSIQLDDIDIKENLPPGTIVGRLKATDAQPNQNIVYSAHSLDGKPLFRCRGATLVTSLVFKWKPGGENTYGVRIRAQDNGSPRMWTEQLFNITVTNVNDPPRSIEISKNSIYENASVGSIVGRLSAIDDDVSQGRSSEFSWKLLPGNSSENFNISGVDVIVRKRLNYDVLKVHYIKVACADSMSAVTQRDIPIHVINSIDPPTLKLSGNKIPENSPPGTIIGQIEAKSESNQDMVFSLSVPNAHARSKFVLSTPTVCLHHQNATKFNTTCFVNLTVSGRLDFEEQNAYTIQIFVKNIESSNFKIWNISVGNVNEKPDKLELNGMTRIPEETKSEDDFCLLMVSDPDNRNTMIQRHLCHVVNQGGDGQYFQVNHVTNALQVKANKTLDYERQQRYHVTLTCTDNGQPPLSITQNVTINVTDTDEPIENLTLSNNQIWENATVGTIIGILNAYDPDIHRPTAMTFSLVDPKAGSFRLQGENNNQLVLNQSIDFEENPAFVVTIRVTDTGGGRLQWPFRINVLDVNEPPTDILLSTTTMNENLLPGTLISNITMVDEDENTMTNCEILQDGQGRVSVNETMLIAGDTIADYEMDPSHNLGISLRCCDQLRLCFTKNFNIEINDINEPPTDITIDNLQVRENQKDLVIGKIKVSDPDNNQKHFCTLSNETKKENYLRILNENKTLYLIKELNFEKESVKRFQINCREEGNVSPYSLMKEFDLNVIDVNEAPSKGCLHPFYVFPEQSSGTIIGSLNVTDPDNEIFNDKEVCQQKQQLRYTLIDTSIEILPFEVIGGYLVKTTQIQANKTYILLISVQDDGVVSSLTSAHTVTKSKTIRFNCTVLTTTLPRPLITLSANRVHETSVNGTIIGSLDTITSAEVNSSYYGNTGYQLVQERCNSYPFITFNNKLMLMFNEQRQVRVNYESEIPNYVIIHVKTKSSVNGSSDVIQARFLILIKDDKNVQSGICFSHPPLLRNKVLDTKLGPIGIYQDYSNNSDIKRCPVDTTLPGQGSNYICNVKPRINDSSPDFTKVNLTNAIYVDRDMFLRFNTSLDHDGLNLEKLVVQVTCEDPRMPLLFIRGKLTLFLTDCSRNTENKKNICALCKHQLCGKEETCVDRPEGGYECKPTWNTCEGGHKRDDNLCNKVSCPEDSLCSPSVNSSQRCIQRSDQLFIGLTFLLHENSTCKFENCLGELLGNQGSACLKEWSNQRRHRRDTSEEFYVEILDISSSIKYKKSLVRTVVWKLENGVLQMQKRSLFMSRLQNTKDVVFIKSKEDCSIFENTEVQCPMGVSAGLTTEEEKGSPLQRPKVQAALGVGVAIILIIIIIVIVYCLRKKRNKKRQMRRESRAAVMGDFNNLAFDGTETQDRTETKKTPKTEEKEMVKESRPQNKHKKDKKGKEKFDFNNPVYEEPRELQSIKDRNVGIYNEDQSSEYTEPQNQDKHHFKGPKTLFNPFYAASDKILVQKAQQTSGQNLNSKSSVHEKGNPNKTEMVNPREKAKQSDPANKYPYYEELPPVADSMKQKHFLGQRNKTNDNTCTRTDSSQACRQNEVNNQGNTKDSSVYYHVLETSNERVDRQGNKHQNNDDENNKTSPAFYFVLEKPNNGSSDKQYQSLHRELDPPPPEYESYRVPGKSGAQNNDQATQARVYEEPFQLGEARPQMMADNPDEPLSLEPS